MSRTTKYQAPDNAPAGEICWRFHIPDDEQIRAAFYDVLAYLSLPNSWQDGDNFSAIDAASLFADLIENSDTEIECEDELVPVITGEMKAYAGSAAPDGWLLCDGTAVSRTTYAALFAVIGTTYGAGNGTTTFNVPDLRYRAPVQAGTLNYSPGVNGEAIARGAKQGNQYGALAVNHLPAHTHTVKAQTAGGTTTNPAFTRGSHLATDIATSAGTGTGDQFPVQSPVLGVNWLIKV